MAELQPIAEYAHKKVLRDGDIVLKQFDATYPKEDIFNEALNQVRVETTDLNIPKVRDVRQSEDGAWTITMDYIPGDTLAQRMEQHPERMEEYIRILVRLQCDVTSHEAPANLPRLREKLRRKLESPDLKVDASTRYELRTRLDSMPRKKKLIHGDFEPRNIIFGEDGMYIIDWAHASRGNAAADAAKTYMVLMLKNGKEVAEYYLNEISREADIPKQVILKWTPIMAASHMLRRNERNKEFLAGWLDVFDYQ